MILQWTTCDFVAPTCSINVLSSTLMYSLKSNQDEWKQVSDIPKH